MVHVFLVALLAGCGEEPAPEPAAPGAALPAPPAPPAGLENLLVLTRTLPAGAVVGPDDIGWRPIAPAFHPAEAVRDPARLVGTTLLHPVVAGEVIFEARLTRPVPRPLPDHELIDVPGLQQLGLALQSGDLVDVVHHGGAEPCLVATVPVLRDTDGKTWLQVPAPLEPRLARLERGTVSMAGRRVRTAPPGLPECAG